MIEVVTHCWSGKDVPIYHRLLRLQLNSLLTFQPKCPVRVTVFYSDQDANTLAVIEEARKEYAIRSEKVYPLTLATWSLPSSQLFRRAIGRNMAALATRAEMIWFTDCDHLFGEDCLYSVLDLCTPEVDLHWPQFVQIHKRHRYGDYLLQSDGTNWGHLQINRSSFQPREERAAWGGLQIVRGDFARRHGYLKGTGWVEPVEADHFLSCKCDVPFRKTCPNKRAELIPNLYRVRHSRAGRDRGQKDHGK